MTWQRMSSLLYSNITLHDNMHAAAARVAGGSKGENDFHRLPARLSVSLSDDVSLLLLPVKFPSHRLCIQ
jgi:hypothetical protein